MAENNDSKRLWLGIIFLVLGGVWLLDNLDVMYFDDFIPHYVFSWKTLLLLIGAFLFFGRDKKSPGLILMFIGGFFLLDEIFWFNVHFWEVFWPAILLFLGAALIFRRGNTDEVPKGDPDYIDDMAVFGGGERRINSKNFKGGKITAVFGGSNVNLMNADFPDGTTPVIDLFMMFGGTEIRVPDDWTVKMETSVIFGGFSDKRKGVLEVVNNPEKTIIVKGLVLFGGGEIK